MTYEEHFKSLIGNLNKRFPKLVKKYGLSVSHSGGGCFHIEMSLGKDHILINPYNKDVEYDIPKSNKSRCIFGIYKDGVEEHKTFFKSFEQGLKLLKNKLLKREKSDESKRTI